MNLNFEMPKKRRKNGVVQFCQAATDIMSKLIKNNGNEWSTLEKQGKAMKINEIK